MIGKKNLWMIISISLAIIMICASASTAAEKFPAKPIKIIVPFAPGGGSDVSIRVYAKYAQEYLGQPFVVANIAGGGGTVGALETLKARPDGYTLFWHHEAIHVSYLTGVADFGWSAFYPVCEAGYAVDLVGVKKEAPWNTIDEFMQYIKANPGKLRMAATIGATTHFTTVEMDLATGGGNKIVLVSSGGDSDKATKILGGFIEAGVFSMPGVASFIEAGKIKGLATTGPERSKFMPDLPSMVERGYEVLSEKNYVIFAPPKLPKDVAEVLAKAFEKMTKDPRVVKDLAVQTVTPLYFNHEEVVKRLTQIEARYAKIAKAAGISKK
jgi:tripartite-type tricarboxylate transporter receptor subunit TctC